MGFKRKRSVEEEVEDISPTSSTSSGGRSSSSDHHHRMMLRASISPSPLPHPTSFLSTINDHSLSRAFPWQSHSSGMLHSRTRKRWRDNRPDEAAIHNNTLHKLFSAQRQQHQQQQQQNLTSSVAIQVDSEALPPPAIPAAVVQKTSLHAFWSLPGAPAADSTGRTNFADTATTTTAYENGGHCSAQRTCMDCDASLAVSGFNGARIETRWDGALEDDEEGFACCVCGKPVCDRCAVVRDARVCLDCVMMD